MTNESRKRNIADEVVRSEQALQAAREFADYDAAVSFTFDEARAAVADAESVSSVLRSVLQRDGWLAP